ncbi:SdrD B-like domain-containing protein [Lacipirellula sp.]|uniref:SdrD B-like domain-containing protein n=1 Tax=Lacipirellula sp. TaxID=2691419 RepID=UPI003D09CAF8
MIFRHRWGRRALAATCACLAATLFASNALAVSRLSGYTYVDRYNDGILLFNDAPHPDLVIPNVEIKLYSVSGMTETLLSTVVTSDIGLYSFTNLAAGTYSIRQTHPFQYLDGIDTLGTIRNLNNNNVPPGANVGTLAADAFVNIVLPDNARGEMYNFGERGLLAQYASKRNLLGSAPPPQYAPDPNGVPEPATASLFALGGMGLLAMKRRANRNR